jgi:hypothetical protein
LEANEATKLWLRRIQVWAEIAGAGVGEASKMVGAAILHADLGLAGFESARVAFSRLNYVPAMWDAQLATPRPLQTHLDAEWANGLSTVGLEGRFLAWNRLPVEESPRRPFGLAAIQRGISELDAAEMVRIKPSREVVSGLPLPVIKNVLKAHKLPVGGRKADILERLTSLPEVEWLGLIPVGPHREISPPPRSEAYLWAEAFHFVLAHTLLVGAAAQRSLSEYESAGLLGCEIVVTDDCPVCRTLAPRGLRVTFEQLERNPKAAPPFHPGCRCGVSPWIDRAITSCT